MGQRLVITIHAFNEDIAKIYYHWSAYTTSAFQEAKDIIDNVNWFDTTSKDELILRITRRLEKCGGGVNIRDREAFKKKYPNETFKDDINRNYGLIAITKDSMEELEYWSEGDLTIDFDEEKVYNEVMITYVSDEEFRQDRADAGFEDDDVDVKNIQKILFDPTEVHFFALDSAIKTLDGLQFCRYFGQIYELTI
nr:MAG TPA: hypothetical protein [Caudoviricetes sp.]